MSCTQQCIVRMESSQAIVYSPGSFRVQRSDLHVQTPRNRYQLSRLKILYRRTGHDVATRRVTRLSSVSAPGATRFLAFLFLCSASFRPKPFVLLRNCSLHQLPRPPAALGDSKSNLDILMTRHRHTMITKEESSAGKPRRKPTKALHKHNPPGAGPDHHQSVALFFSECISASLRSREADDNAQNVL